MMEKDSYFLGVLWVRVDFFNIGYGSWKASDLKEEVM